MSLVRGTSRLIPEKIREQPGMVWATSKQLCRPRHDSGGQGDRDPRSPSSGKSSRENSNDSHRRRRLLAIHLYERHM